MLPGSLQINSCMYDLAERANGIYDHDVDEVDYEHDGKLQDAMTVLNLISNTYFQTKDDDKN